MKDFLNKTELSLLKNLSILFVEDNFDVQQNVSILLEMYFKNIYIASNGAEGLEKFQKFAPDMVITDIRMPVMDGLTMCKRIKNLDPDIPLIIVTAFCEVDLLMQSIEIGVDKYVRKPIDIGIFLDALYKSALPLIQKKEIANLNEKIFTSLESRISKSDCMKDVIRRIQRVSNSDFSVVIYGETGVGKSFIARTIHDLSSRSSKPFVTVDIGAIPETLVESELFGYSKGAFTGADKNKKGFFEIANGGTLFLEDLENISPYAQSKLLRAVEDRKIYPLGSTTPVDVDIRIIAATNVELFEEVKQKRFRDDLFYRLCEFDITIAPLRERKEDILMLAHRFVVEVAEELNRKIKKISEEAENILKSHYWRGNIRELKNVMRRAVLISEEDCICGDTIANSLKLDKEVTKIISLPVENWSGFTFHQAVEEAEKRVILYALDKNEHKIMKTASELHLDYKTLMRKIKKLGIDSN